MFEPTKEYYERMNEYHDCNINLMNLIITLKDLMKKYPELVGKQVYGFGNPHSYRGYYSEISFEPCFTTIEDMYDCAISSIDKEFTGWKGGDFVMTELTECYMAEEGNLDSNDDGITYDRILEIFNLTH